MLSHWSAAYGDNKRGLLHALIGDREHQDDDPTGPMLVHAATTHVRTAWQY
jgi:hypothetical protein